MNYTKKSFSVTAPGTKTYAENWERTFRGAPAPPRRCICGHVEQDHDDQDGCQAAIVGDCHPIEQCACGEFRLVPPPPMT